MAEKRNPVQELNAVAQDPSRAIEEALAIQRAYELAQALRAVDPKEGGPPLPPDVAAGLVHPMGDLPRQVAEVKRDLAEVSYAIGRGFDLEEGANWNRLPEAVDRLQRELDPSATSVGKVALAQGVLERLEELKDRAPDPNLVAAEAERVRELLRESAQALPTLDRQALEEGIRQAQVRMGIGGASGPSAEPSL